MLVAFVSLESDSEEKKTEKGSKLTETVHLFHFHCTPATGAKVLIAQILSYFTFSQ